MLILFSCSEKEPVKDTLPSKKPVNPFYEKSFALLEQDKQDSAFRYFDKARELFLKRNDSFGAGKSLVNMAIIQECLGDNFGSIETSLAASEFFEEKNPAHFSFLFSNYNNLGVASNNLKNYNDASNFYRKALSFTNDPIDKMMIDNNIAVIFHNQKKYSEAVEIYRKLVDSIGKENKFYPKMLLNYTRSKWFQNPEYNPVSNYHHVIKMSQSNGDNWTKDAAYSYLSVYYLDKNRDSSEYYARKMLSLAKRLKYPSDQLEALQNLIKLTNGKESRQYFDEYSKIQDSVISSQNEAKNQFALIRFESEKAKAENLRLQKEHAMQQYKVNQQKLMIWLLIIIFLIITIVTIFWIKRRRERMILQANNNLQEQRLDFSKKVHDVVANGLYEVISTIENQNEIPKEKILDKLELMYEKSRDLSYSNESETNFNERISGLIHSFDNDETPIIIIGNESGFWENIADNKKEDLFQIIRELLVNMRKHSAATQVILRFVKDHQFYEIFYSDNGIGLPENITEKNGFTNIKSRLNEMYATMHIQNREIGMKISIRWQENSDA